MITVTFHCSGCSATAPGKRPLERHFTSISGRAYGLGSYQDDRPADVAPDGWIAHDPYTQVTYCPDCWAEITGTLKEKKNES